MTEYETEPVRGLPGDLPAGERVLWQGAPDWRVLARTAFHVRLVTGYFALLAGWAAAGAIAGGGSWSGVVTTTAVGAVGVALLHLLAFAAARSTVYTLTDRRIVLRIGIAVPKCINLPLVQIGAVDLAVRDDGTGDVPLTVAGPAKLGMLTLWPHARAWRIVRPQPMLRAVPDAQRVAALIAGTCHALQPAAPVASATPPRVFAEAVAA